MGSANPVEVFENGFFKSLDTANFTDHPLYTRPVRLYVNENATMTYRNEKNVLITISHGYNKTLATLQMHGHQFNHLTITIGIQGYNFAENITDYINKYCTRAYLEVNLLRGYDIDDIQFSLKNYTSVSIIHTFNTTGVDQLSLDNAFPRMQKLNIDYHMNIEKKFPNLIEFVYFPTNDDPHAVHLNEFIKLNPQLQSIQTSLYYDRTFLPTLSSELLPNLESLNLRTNDVPHANDTVKVAKFKHVKHLTLNVRHSKLTYRLERMLESIQCERLESFTVESHTHHHGFLFNLMWRNKGLRSVTLLNTYPLSAVVAVNKQLPQLKELTMFVSIAGLSNLRELLAGAKTLDTVTIRLNPFNEVKYEDIVKHVPKNWSHSMRPDEYVDTYDIVQLKRST